VTLETGQWDDAHDIATSIAEDRPEGAPPLPSIVALTVLGRLRSRRGDPGTAQTLERAWDLASATGDLQRLWPAAAARAEAALLDGDEAAVPGLVAETLDLAQRIGHPWAIGELALMLHRCGHPAPHDDRTAMPYALHLEGRFEEAAHAWHALGCPYEEAMALADGDDDQVLRALAILDQLGARRPAAALRQRMRGGGSRAVPRGPRPTTATHPDGLTVRQAEVLALVAEGMTNAEIAHRLFISEKTAGHHVSAILAKLGVANRAEAARRYEQSERPT
jgi:DNA-binding CsgD family transcriptional regulator